ncbi:MAG: carboxypeptidase-like regulatory domain-containing protein [Candidatus Acidiferrales bacterium]
MIRRTIAFVFAASLLLATGAIARVHTTKIGGTISAPNGTPAVGVQVMVERSDGSRPLATRTDSHGHFLFKLIPPGLYDIRASDATAASVWKHNLVVHSRKETVVNLHLERTKQLKKTLSRPAN